MNSKRKNSEPVTAVLDGQESAAPVLNGLLPGEALPVENLKFSAVPPERLKVAGWKFKSLVPGETAYVKVVRLVEQHEADNSDPAAPLFHGVYCTEYPSGAYVILNAHYQVASFMRDEISAGANANKVYGITMLAKKEIGGGRTAYDYAFTEALLPA